MFAGLSVIRRDLSVDEAVSIMRILYGTFRNFCFDFQVDNKGRDFITYDQTIEYPDDYDIIGHLYKGDGLFEICIGVDPDDFGYNATLFAENDNTMCCEVIKRNSFGEPMFEATFSFVKDTFIILEIFSIVRNTSDTSYLQLSEEEALEKLRDKINMQWIIDPRLWLWNIMTTDMKN